MNRITLDLKRVGRCTSTPWGMADFVTTYGDGVNFFETPSHGGFQLSPERLAEMPEPFKSHQPYCGQQGWYEEDCDWSAVALSFPDLFTLTELEAASRTWSYIVERKKEAA